MMTDREFALDVVRRLRDSGHEALWAGGCVRDQLLGVPPKDYDVATSARPEEVRRLFRRTVAVGMNFGVIDVIGPRTESGNLEIQVATFRSDVSYSDGRHPDAVVFSSAKEDALRRDFTINGMFYDPIADEVIDYVGGRADLEAGLIRAIGDPHERIEEDKLRMLRALRFSTRFGFAIDPTTEAAIRDRASQLGVVSAERIADELRKILTHPNRRLGISLFADTGLTACVLPETVALADEVWQDTLAILEALGDDVSVPLAFAGLLYSIGGDDGQPDVTGKRAKDICVRLKMSNEERDRIVWLADHREALAEPQTLPLHRLKPILAHPGIDELLRLHAAVASARSRSTEHVAFCERKLEEWPCEVLVPEPLLTGHDLQEMGLEPGRIFKELLDAVRDSQLDEAIHTPEEAKALVRQRLAER